MPLISPRQITKLFDEYYRSLDGYSGRNLLSLESTTENAMKTLLDGWCHSLGGWQLVKLDYITPGGERVIPDGTVRDALNLTRGYWEAKDTADDLETEIKKKRQKGYPFDKNLLFDDTTTAVLFQDLQQIGACPIRSRTELADLLEEFFRWSAPPIEQFHQAISQFNQDLPKIAEKLHALIAEAKRTNRSFVDQINAFLEVCRASLNPATTQEQVEEMLAQHLLTERVARRVFQYDQFRDENAVAHELEKLADAFFGQSLSRDGVLGGLNYYFRAVENYADQVNNLREKQDFLNSVYEPFLKAYSPKEADRQGIVYTPQPIVRFMVASVEAALGREFGKSLGDAGVHILDPCTGTGNFIVEVMEKIPRDKLEYKYRHELWANEVMLLPYYIAGLNIEAKLYERMNAYIAFPGICFTDTLLLNSDDPRRGGLFSAENAERIKREEDANITVIIGNPPYNAWQESENQNAKNISHEYVMDRIKKTYVADTRATLKNSLYDPYIQFFRWASDRIGEEGIVCFVSNNAFLDGYAASGLRKHLLHDYSAIYHLDLGGNVRRNPKISGTTHNVFGIQVGVGITVLLRKKGEPGGRVFYARVDEFWTRFNKYEFLDSEHDFSKIEWQELIPTDEYREWFTPISDFETLIALGNKTEKAKEIDKKESIFAVFGAGVKTNRDEIVYDFDRWQLEQRMKRFIEAYNLEVDRWKRSDRKQNLDDFVRYEVINWSGDLKVALSREKYAEFDDGKIRKVLYRPFNKKYLYFDSLLNNSIYLNPYFFPNEIAEKENRIIWLKVGNAWPTFALISDHICDLLPQGGSQCFPLYVYDEDGSNRRENITPWGIKQFTEHYCGTSSLKPGKDTSSLNPFSVNGDGTLSESDLGSSPLAVYGEGSGVRSENTEGTLPESDVGSSPLAVYGEGSGVRSENTEGTLPESDVGSSPLAVYGEGQGVRSENTEGTLSESDVSSPPQAISGDVPGVRSENTDGTLSESDVSSSPLAVHGEGPGVRFEHKLLIARKEGEVWYTDPILWEKLKPLAKQMRQEPTEAEDILWQRLRNRKLLGLKFRRQHTIERFIVDFYCKELRMVIEVDGPIHNYTPQEDKIREEFLEGAGLTVLRFTNDLVLKDIDSVIRQLTEKSNEIKKSPLAVYGEGSGVRSENTDGTLSESDLSSSLQAISGDVPGVRSEEITPWRIFHYVYAVLHAKSYRSKYAANLRKSLPRIPLLGDVATFSRLAELGEQLAELHLNYETADRFSLKRVENPKVEWSWLCPKLRLDSKDKSVIRYNDALTLEGLPPRALEYRLGNRSAVEWVLDQYRTYPAKDEFVIDLIERVITVSLKTVDIVAKINQIYDSSI